MSIPNDIMETSSARFSVEKDLTALVVCLGFDFPLESVGHVVADSVHVVASVTGTTVKTAGHIVGTTVKTTGKIATGTVKATGKVVGGTVNAVGNIAGGSQTKKGKVAIPPQVQTLVHQVLNGESVSPFADWDDFIAWLDTSSDCADYSSTLINQQMKIISSEKSVNEGLQFLALCLNMTKVPGKGISMVLKITVGDYEKKLSQMSAKEREVELVAIMLYFCKLCDLFGIR